jgi:copper chaperone NosL
MTSWRLTAALSVTAVLPACGEQTAVAPPTILYGQDVCDVCGMIISDDRFAAGLVLKADDAYATRAFDDVGCMLAYETDHVDEDIVALYIHDHQSRQWHDAEAATYLHSAEIHSPMAFGLAACAVEADTRALAVDHPGDIIDFAAVRQRFDAGRLAILPTRKGNP